MNPPLYNYRLLIMYDGTPFKGWQVQPNGTTIQALLQEAIRIITKKDVHIIGSGRTDAGVHALGQTANFTIDRELNLYRFQHSLNGLLPLDIRVLEVTPAPLAFHSQYSALRKAYRYQVSLGPCQSPFQRRHSWHFKEKIDLDILQSAAKQLVGTHNFLSFANEGHAGCASVDPVRTIYRIDIQHTPPELSIEIEADGFLYRMVRNIVGTLFDIARGKMPADAIPEILAACDRRKAGIAAPPHGLFLVKVDY